MSLASLVDKPLMQNPLAGGGAPQIIDPSVITPRGGAPETDDPIMQGYFESEFYKPSRAVTADVVNYTYQGKPMQGSSSELGYLQQYLDSIGKGDLIQRPNNMFAQIGVQDLAKMEKNPYGTEFIGLGADQTNLFGYKVPDEVIKEQEERMRNNPISMLQVGQSQPIRPEQIGSGLGDVIPNPDAGIADSFPGNPNRKPADPANLGSAKVGIFPFPGMDSTETATATVPNPMQTGDQGLMDRLTSLEQGIGSLQNQIANLFQMGQASDPFGLGGFINTRRY